MLPGESTSVQIKVWKRQERLKKGSPLLMKQEKLDKFLLKMGNFCPVCYLGAPLHIDPQLS